MVHRNSRNRIATFLLWIIRLCGVHGAYESSTARKTQSVRKGKQAFSLLIKTLEV